MSRLVSVLFITLLLLRSLMGSAMAAGPLPNLPLPLPLPAMHHTAQPAPAPLALASDNTASACPDAAGPGCADHADHSGHPDCSTCASCHSVMLASPTLCARSASTPGDKTADTACRFASALAAPAIKPPIA